MGVNTVRERIAELECMKACDPLSIKREAVDRGRAIREDAVLYYDEENDAQRIKLYYAEALEGSPDRDTLFSRLHALLQRTHTYHIPYHVSKDQYLYPWVDLHPDGRLCCIYSGVRMDPERAIEEDYDTILLRFARFRQLVINDRLGKTALLRQITEIAREHKFNTEHIVPQSWFDEQEPMKGDLHHLFVCKPKCNNARANFHYFEFPPGRVNDGYASIHDNHCGAGEPGLFEPNRGKGAAARALLYFLLRYPGAIKPDFRSGIDVNLLLRWHWKNPVTLFEKHRNMAIGDIQGNRNPLIDLPELAGRIDFTVSWSG
jgi:endonuclease I